MPPKRPTRSGGPPQSAAVVNPIRASFFGEAVLTMELPRRHATPFCSRGRLAPLHQGVLEEKEEGPSTWHIAEADADIFRRER